MFNADYHPLQRGRGNFHVDRFPLQRGRGLGGLFASMFQKILPFGKSFFEPFLIPLPDTSLPAYVANENPPKNNKLQW